MNLLDLVEEWAKENGFWTYRHLAGDKVYGPYLNVSRLSPSKRASTQDFITIWPNGVCSITDHQDTKLTPADPAFFDKIKQRIL